MPTVRLIDLVSMHPRLLWSEIATAAAAVFTANSRTGPFTFELAVEDVPGFGTDKLHLSLEAGGIEPAHIAALRRTYEFPRLVELAGIAIAGIGLHVAGGHEIRDIALRGSGADYLIDDANHFLEVAGRSRRADFSEAWRERWDRLAKRTQGGYYVCVSELSRLRESSHSI